MRNLKKVLSMLLVIAMMFSFMAVSMAADDVDTTLVDFDTISEDQQEAIALLAELAIVKGIARDGKYYVDPQADIDRNSFAKIAFMMMEGSEDASYYVGASSFSDVAGTWAEGYVAYLQSWGIVSGNEKGEYAGTAPLTVTTASKIALTSMGYDSAEQGFEGDNWATNIIRAAQRQGILNGVTQSANENITRENAFRIIFNALFATSVEPTRSMGLNGERYVSGYNATGTLGLSKYGVAKAQVALGEVGVVEGFSIVSPASLVPAAIGTTNKNAAMSDAADYTFGPDTVGGVATFFVKVETSGYNAIANTFSNVTYKSLISEAARAAEANELSCTFGNRTLVDLTTTTGDNKKQYYVAPLATGWVAYNNGTEVTKAAGDADLETTVGKLIKRGVEVDLIGNDAGEVAIVRLTTKSVGTLSANPSSSTKGDTTTVKVPGILATAGVASGKVSGWENLKEGDVVLYVNVGGVTYIEKADIMEDVEKKQDTSSTSSVILKDGKTYNQSGLVTSLNADNAPNLRAAVAYNVVYDLYLDNGGNVVLADAQTEDTSSNYAYVIGSGLVPASYPSKPYIAATILFTDGSFDTVTVYKVGADELTTSAADVTKVADLQGRLVNFGKNSKDQYSLTAVAGATSMTAGTASFSKNAKNIKDGTTSIVTVNSNTTFIIYNAADEVYEVYTGNANAPSVENIKGLFLKDDNGFAKFVIITESNAPGSAGDYVYFTTVGGYSTNEDGIVTLGGVYVNGIGVDENDDGLTVQLDSLALISGASAKIVAGGLYEVKRDADGIITDIVGSELLGSKLGEVKAVGGGVITITSAGSEVTLGYSASETEVFIIYEEDGEIVEGGVGDISKEAEVIHRTDDSGDFLMTIYIYISAR